MFLLAVCLSVCLSGSNQIWFVSKHQRVPHYIGVMNRYFDEHRRDELSLIPKATHIKLPLRLTASENSVNAQQGTVLLLGRSGTGKTVCLCNRMTSDRRRLQAAIVRRSDRIVQQLFVCRRCTTAYLSVCTAVCVSYLEVTLVALLLHQSPATGQRGPLLPGVLLRGPGRRRGSGLLAVSGRLLDS